MKDKFKSKNNGVSLMELLIVITLVGLIFSLGIYPIITQLKLFGVHRNEITLFDEANLAVFYLTTDAMRAESFREEAGSTRSWPPTTFWHLIFTVTTDYSTAPRTKKDITYSYSSSNAPTKLIRSFDGSSITVTNKLSQQPQVFQYKNDPKHIFRCRVQLQEPGDPTKNAQREIHTMLRCRDAHL